MAKNKSDNLRKAKAAKNDEFYTRLEDIEAEISEHQDYVRQFKDKVVLCPCDDPLWSNFFVFFRNHFAKLGIKKLITTHYNADGSPSYMISWQGQYLNDDMVGLDITPMKGNGDFRSDEVREIMREYGEELIVVTNPMFSLFREFIAQLEEYHCKYVLLGNMNAIAYKEFFPLLKDNKVFIGYNTGAKTFRVPDDFENSSTFTKDGIKYAKFGNICWYTNLDLDKTHEPITLNCNYKGHEDRYPVYCNFNAIECGKINNIPKDYYGIIGVPITYMSEHCPSQFKILGMGTGDLAKQLGAQRYDALLSGKALDKMRELRPNYGALFTLNKDGMPSLCYNRILIQRIPEEEKEE